MIVTLALAAAGAAVWTVRLRRLLRAPVATDGAVPPVSIIVPARDEAHNLPALLGSLARMSPRAAEVIVVDDHSTDGTGDLARAAGATVVAPPPLPDDWIGKSWACARGAREATGDWLLFTDADTAHAPDSLARVMAHQRATGADLVTVVPTHTLVAPWEHLQGPFQLMLLVASGRDYAIGQYLLFRRRTYDAIGGHAAVRHRLGEDLALLAAVRAGGGRAAVVHAPELLRVRMYPEGVIAFLRGWRRSFRDGLGVAGWRGVLGVGLVFAWLGGLPLALGGALLAGDRASATVLGVAWLASTIEVARRQRRLGAFRAWTALLAPLSLVAFAACTAAAVIDQLRGAPVRWRGRAIPAPRRTHANDPAAPAPDPRVRAGDDRAAGPQPRSGRRRRGERALGTTARSRRRPRRARRVAARRGRRPR